MECEMLNLKEIPEYIMLYLKNRDIHAKKDIIKQFIIHFLRKNQRFSSAVRNFEYVFKIRLPNHIRKIILAEKELFDLNKEPNSEEIEQLSVYLVKTSPICDDSIINARFCSTKQIIGRVIS